MMSAPDQNIATRNIRPFTRNTSIHICDKGAMSRKDKGHYVSD